MSEDRDEDEAPFASLLAGSPAGFVANEIEAYAPLAPCIGCGHASRGDRRIVRPFAVNEDLFAGASVTLPDFVSIRYGGLIVSKRFADALRTFGARGVSLGEVLRADTGQVSTQFFQLTATSAITAPCAGHTRLATPPCALCGYSEGRRPRNVYLEEGFLRELDVVSRSPYGTSELYFSRALRAYVEEAGIDGLFPGCALESCTHELSMERAGAVIDVANVSCAPVATRSRPSVEAFLAFVRASGTRVVCEGRDAEPERAFEVASLLEPGANPAALDALEARLPDVRFLRELALAADGILLFHQAGMGPSRFPTRDAVQATEGEVCVHAAIQFEKSTDWLAIKDAMQEDIRDFQQSEEVLPFRASSGVPFATIVGSSHRLVCADGGIYYFCPLGNDYYNQRIARDLNEFFGLVMENLAPFLLDGAAVTRYYDDAGNEHVPRAFLPPS